MTGAGGWLENAEIESYFKTLKYRCAHGRSWDDALEAEVDLLDFIDYYNYRRPHTALGGKTPASVFLPACTGKLPLDFPGDAVSALGLQQLGLTSV